jgi:hypothetical protein
MFRSKSAEDVFDFELDPTEIPELVQLDECASILTRLSHVLLSQT